MMYTLKKSTFCLLSIPFFLAATGLPSEAAQLIPTSISLRTGSYAGSAANLAKAGEGKIVRLYSNGSGYLKADFNFSNVGSAKSVQIVFKQNRSRDVYTFQLINADGSLMNFGSTTGGTAYKNLSFPIPAVSGSATVRVVTGPNAGDSAIDYLVMTDSSVTPPPTTPTPVGANFPSGISWYWQLQGAVNTGVNALVYDIDLFDNSAALITSLKANGHKVICYFSAGSYEPNRPDSSKFTAAVLGSELQGWPGEKWVDVRAPLVRSIMVARLDLAKTKGCDAVEPDNVDGFDNVNGLGLTKADQIDYLNYLADQAHSRGLLIALKNSTALVSTLVNKFDFAVVEECFRYNECSEYSPFAAQNKAVLNAEYSSFSEATCSQARSLKFSTVFYNLDLDGRKFQPCQ